MDLSIVHTVFWGRSLPSESLLGTDRLGGIEESFSGLGRMRKQKSVTGTIRYMDWSQRRS